MTGSRRPTSSHASPSWSSEDPQDLALDGGSVRVALDLAVDDAGVVLADDHARVPAKVVAAEREPHGSRLGLRASRVRAEAEAREQTEIERAARGHRERAGFLARPRL